MLNPILQVLCLESTLYDKQYNLILLFHLDADIGLIIDSLSLACLKVQFQILCHIPMIVAPYLITYKCLHRASFLTSTWKGLQSYRTSLAET